MIILKRILQKWSVILWAGFKWISKWCICANYHSMKALSGDKSPGFLNTSSLIYGNNWSVQHFGRFNRGEWSGLNVVEKRNIQPLPRIEPQSPLTHCRSLLAELPGLETGLPSFPMSGFGVRNVEHSSSVTTESEYNLHCTKSKSLLFVLVTKGK
jgi:hypothetical protein